MPGVVSINFYGSLARGDERANSDIDIELIVEDPSIIKIDIAPKEGIELDIAVVSVGDVLQRVALYPYLNYFRMLEKVLYDPQMLMQRVYGILTPYFLAHPEVVAFWKEKYRVMRENKMAGKDMKDVVRSYNEAELNFSPTHTITRDFVL